MQSSIFISLTFLLLCFYKSCCFTAVINSNSVPATTTINTRNVTDTTGSISYKVVDKPHHLFIGRCRPEDEVIHQENIVVYNDGKSHVAASIKVQVTDPVYITCVKIFDEIPDGQGGYPSFSAGGVGHDFVEFTVDTEYGRGFHFFIQVYGYSLKESSKRLG